MGWFKNKEEKELLPDLPENTELPNLPDFENNPVGETGEYQYTANLKNDFYPSLPSDINSNQIKNMIGSDVQRSKFDLDIDTPKIPESKLISSEIPDFSYSKKVVKDEFVGKNKSPQQIYIRLDKFQSTKESLDDIKEKIVDIEKMLVKLKELKVKEEKELDEWERETQIIKTRLDSIDSNLFDKIS